MIRILYCLIWFLIVPEILGLGILNFKKENKSMILALILGYIFEFAVFEIIAIPMIFTHMSFRVLLYTWTAIILILLLVSLVLIKKNLKKICSENLQKLKELPKVLLIIFCLLVAFQCYIPFKFMHEDYDDADFVAKAVISIDTNTLYEYSDNGDLLNGNYPDRKVLSPFPVYLGTISKLINVHPTIVAHTIFPVVFISLAYLIYALIGDCLFKKDNKKTLIFLIVFSIIFMFGDYTRYSIFVRLLYRIWQGKSILATIILPFIWYLFIEYLGKENDKFYWIVLFITLLGADLVSSMSLILPTITAGLLTIIYMIKYKKINYGYKFILCCIPSIIYGFIYLFIK